MKLPTTKTDTKAVEEYIAYAREVIDQALPPGAVIPRHSNGGHFYQVPLGGIYPSVTGKLGHVKDESIKNFAMNEALRYVSEHLHEVLIDGKIDMMRAIDLLDQAAKAPTGLLHTAGDIGTSIHDGREKYFQDWIDTGKRPDIKDYILDTHHPIYKAGLLGLGKFLDETGYMPIRCEVMVYSDEHKVAGMLDDIGVMWYEGKWQLTLMDLKTSNQMKAHYWLQVAMYNMMFTQLTGLVPDRNIIVKVNKDYPDYKVEELQDIERLKEGVRAVLKTAETMEFIKEARKDLGKTVIKI